MLILIIVSTSDIWLNENPKFTLFSLLHGFWSCSYKMSQSRAGVSMRASPLTNGKLLAALKGRKPCRITITEVNNIGDRYMQKASSIRFGFIMCWRQSLSLIESFIGVFPQVSCKSVLNKEKWGVVESLTLWQNLRRGCLIGLLRRSLQCKGMKLRWMLKWKTLLGSIHVWPDAGGPLVRMVLGKTFLKQSTKSLWLPMECFSNVWIVQIFIFKVNFNHL